MIPQCSSCNIKYPQSEHIPAFDGSSAPDFFFPLLIYLIKKFFYHNKTQILLFENDGALLFWKLSNLGNK